MTQQQDDEQAKAGEARLAAEEATDEDDFGEFKEDEVEEPAAVAVGASGRGKRRERGPSRRTVIREDRRRRSAGRKTRKRTLYGLGGGLIAAMLIAGLFLPSAGLGSGGRNANTGDGSDSSTSQGDLASVGTSVPIQTASVIEPGAAHGAYNSTPPTSGPRWEEAVDWGVYDVAQADEAVVRNLEQGGVVVNHNLTDQAAIDDLTSYVEAQVGYPGCFVMQPYEAVAPGSVTLTSWGWSESYTGVDRLSMETFVQDHRNNGPLFLGNTCGSDSVVEDAGS